MGTIVQRSLCLLVVLSLVAPLGAAGSAPTLRYLIEEMIADHGLEPHAVLDAPAELIIHHADGRVETGTTTLGDYLREAGLASLQTSTSAPGAGSGVAGTPGAAAGDFLHVYVNFASGSALAYDVSRSAFVPSTPAVFLPGPAMPYAFDVGGPLTQITASDYLVGFHTAGTVMGSSVDTDASGPYVPVLDAGFVLDAQVEFVGHAAVSQSQTCFFGLCVATGTFVGTGAAVFNEPDVVLPRAP